MPRASQLGRDLGMKHLLARFIEPAPVADLCHPLREFGTGLRDGALAGVQQRQLHADTQLALAPLGIVHLAVAQLHTRQALGACLAQAGEGTVLFGLQNQQSGVVLEHLLHTHQCCWPQTV